MKQLPDGIVPVEPLRKPMPRVLEKKLQRAQVEKDRVSIKAQVFARDNSRCRCCGGHATEMHELKSRGSGGKRSLYNSIAVCDYRGNSCHRLLQVFVIYWEFTDASKGANAPICFSDPIHRRVWEG